MGSIGIISLIDVRRGVLFGAAMMPLCGGFHTQQQTPRADLPENPTQYMKCTHRTIIRYTMSRIVPRYRVHELKGIPNLHKKCVLMPIHLFWLCVDATVHL